MTVQEAIDFFNDDKGRFGAINLCNQLGIAKQNVNLWKKRGYISYYQQLRIEKYTDGKLKASLEKHYREKE
jgi:hypothetical protein